MNRHHPQIPVRDLARPVFEDGDPKGDEDHRAEPPAAAEAVSRGVPQGVQLTAQGKAQAYTVTQVLMK